MKNKIITVFLISCFLFASCSKTNISNIEKQDEFGKETFIQEVKKSDISNEEEGYNAIVNDNNVRVREQPSTESTVVGQLNQKMTVTVFGRTQERFFLEGYDSYWLKIKNDNVEGWVYGAYINLLNDQYDSLPVLSTDKPTAAIDLNYSRYLPVSELQDKEQETIRLQEARLSSYSIQDFYNLIVDVFEKQQSLRPFFLNTCEVGLSFTGRFFLLNASTLSDYIQSSYSDNISISELNMYNETSGAFLISGFRKLSDFNSTELTAISINIKKIENANFIPLNGKTIIDFISITSLPPEGFGWDTDYSFMIDLPIYLRYSRMLEIIFNEYEGEWYIGVF